MRTLQSTSDGSLRPLRRAIQQLKKLSPFRCGRIPFAPLVQPLVENGKIVVSENEEVGQAMADNPRTAIEPIEEKVMAVCNYIVIVSMVVPKHQAWTL